MTFPTPRTALQGNPPVPDYQPRKQDIVNVLEQMQAIAATEMLKDFHGAVGDLPGEGNETGDKRMVLATEAEGGGVYSWDGSTWQLVSALPVVFTESISAMLSEAWATGTQPGGLGTKSSREWAEIAADNSRLEIGTVMTVAPGDPATANITGDPGQQLLNLGIPDGADGWTPHLAVVADGARRVLQIADWAGGEGDKPATGGYVGPTGLVADVAQAIDIRGAPGTGDMSTPTYDPQGIEEDAFNRAHHTGTQDAGTVTGLAAVATSGAYTDIQGLAKVSAAGTLLTDADDLDDVHMAGFYAWNSHSGKPSNTPDGSGYWAAMLVMSNPGGAGKDSVQIVYRTGTATNYGKSWVRSYRAGQWMPWLPQQHLGERQTWNNVSGSRSANTTYQNTTDRPIMVAIQARGTSFARQFQVSSNGSTWRSVGEFTTANPPYVQPVISTVIPVGHYYRINGDALIYYWTELD